MKRSSPCIIGLSLMVVALVAAAAPKADNKPTGIFAPLEIGTKVSLKEAAGNYEIGVMPGIGLGYKVIEVGPDFVVLEDATGVTEKRIPIYSIRSVTITRLLRK